MNLKPAPPMTTDCTARSLLAALLCSLSAGPVSAADPGIDATNHAAQAMMESFLAADARRLDATFLEGVSNRTSWEARRAELRAQYLEMLGLWPLPERTPLQARVTGTLERDEGFRVEKVHFQSRPRLYVTGNLYLPKDAKAGDRLPAVLYVCGHSGRGRDGNKTAFQHHGMWFATHGYVCLAIDSLQLGEIAAIHHGTYRYNRWWWPARGYTPAGVECWNGIRAIDYLQSRPEVDPDRIGITGISGGGAASFWIAAADERVKVAVPVSGMGDLEDYVGAKVVNGHCDCMFLINTYQWPWTHIAALVAPRPLLFANSGHDTIFPMNGNDRIRARLERLYGFYTNRTDQLFDIGVTPGGHDDKPELRLMAYRWFNRHLQGGKAGNSPVTEPVLPVIEGSQLRAFPDALPADELNTTIDEVFVPPAMNPRPRSAAEFQAWRETTLATLRRLVFRAVSLPGRSDASLMSSSARSAPVFDGRKELAGTWPTEAGIAIPWKYLPPPPGRARTARGLWLVVLGEGETVESRPAWVESLAGDAPMVVISPRGSGSLSWSDPAPFYVRRSLPLLGRTVDDGRLTDVLAAAGQVLRSKAGKAGPVTVAGRGAAGVLAAYAALFETRLAEVVAVDPPVSHRVGPIFLNVLRVLDVPEAFGLLAPRPLALSTAREEAFKVTADLYRVAGGTVKFRNDLR